MSIGKTLKLLRTAGDISQGELARNLSVTPGYMSLVENGKRDPSLAFLRSAAHRFGIPLGFLMLQGAELGEFSPKQRVLVQGIRRNLLEYILAEKSEPKTARRGRSSIRNKTKQ